MKTNIFDIGPLSFDNEEMLSRISCDLYCMKNENMHLIGNISSLKTYSDSASADQRSDIKNAYGNEFVIACPCYHRKSRFIIYHLEPIEKIDSKWKKGSHTIGFYFDEKRLLQLLNGDANIRILSSELKEFEWITKAGEWVHTAHPFCPPPQNKRFQGTP